MPLYELESPLTGQFSATVRANSRKEAIRYMEAVAEHVVRSEGIMDYSCEVAASLGIDAEMEGFDISGPASRAVVMEGPEA